MGGKQIGNRGGDDVSKRLIVVDADGLPVVEIVGRPR
jgi:hypothetical protein